METFATHTKEKRTIIEAFTFLCAEGTKGAFTAFFKKKGRYQEDLNMPSSKVCVSRSSGCDICKDGTGDWHACPI